MQFVRGCVIVSIVAALLRSEAGEERAFVFEKSVAPVLVKRCLECHNASDRQGELYLGTREAALKGGESGAAIVPGTASESLLYQKVEAGEMPPEKEGKSNRLSQEEVAAIQAWIEAGAVWPEGRVLSPYEMTTESRAGLDWWSLKEIQRREIPIVEATATRDKREVPSAVDPRNALDAFLGERLSKSGMRFAPAADARTLARRVHFDLTGLPASYEEIEAFAGDSAPDAYERLVDRLLGSPAFGERWGRYWLDLVRFAETCGYERDQEKPNAWRYRDWVVNAINEGMPHDRFVREQLAGDELADRTEDTVIATGFLRLGTWNDEPNDPLEYKYERIEDLVHTTSTAFLGLTVKCARCHDHKFDPIPQVDYYRLAAVFWAGHVEPRGADLLGGPSRDELGYAVLGYTDRGREPPPLHLLRKGDPHRPEYEIAPGMLSCVVALDGSMRPPPPDSKTSLRRSQLADWLTHSRNPLPARVAVNRIWQHHFGAGLVRTPDNFGFTGEQPTHPELLDWLADELMAGGWRTKRIHRLLLDSHAYRQSSMHPEEARYRDVDAGNRLWWRAERRRRDAESLRDAMLEVAGQLDRRVGGPSFKPEIGPDALEGLSMKGGAWAASAPVEQRRRSLYMFSKRSLLAPLMTTFDFSDTSQPCARREVTTVPTQALALLNNAFVHEMSGAVAERILAKGNKDRGATVDEAWRIVMGRLPTQSEREASRAHLEAQEARFLSRASERDSGRLALASLCHVLLNANEFLYVD